jgi:hypothetical protein
MRTQLAGQLSVMDEAHTDFPEQANDFVPRERLEDKA